MPLPQQKKKTTSGRFRDFIVNRWKGLAGAAVAAAALSVSPVKAAHQSKGDKDAGDPSQQKAKIEKTISPNDHARENLAAYADAIRHESFADGISASDLPLSDEVDITPDPDDSDNMDTDLGLDSTTDQVVTILQDYLPEDIDPAKVQLYASALQTLAQAGETSSVTDLPASIYECFARLAQDVPEDQLRKIVNKEPTEFSFGRLQSILHLTPNDAQAFADQAFYLDSRYTATQRLFDILPLDSHEKSIDWFYGDVNRHMMIDTGINVDGIHNDLLPQIHVRLTPDTYKILHPDDPECLNLPKGPVTLTPKDIQTLQADAKKRGFDEHTSAATYKSTYGLQVIPEDLPKLHAYRRKLIVEFLQSAERKLEARKPASMQNESALFGTPEEPVPTEFIDALLDFLWRVPNPEDGQYKNFLERRWDKLKGYRNEGGLCFRRLNTKKKCYEEQNKRRNDWTRARIDKGIEEVKENYNSDVHAIMELTYLDLLTKNGGRQVQAHEFLPVFFANAHALAQSHMNFHTIFPKDRKECFEKLGPELVRMLYPTATKAQIPALQEEILSTLSQLEKKRPTVTRATSVQRPIVEQARQRQ